MGPDARVGISKEIERAMGERGWESDRAIPLQDERAGSQMTCLMVRVSLLSGLPCTDCGN